MPFSYACIQREGRKDEYRETAERGKEGGIQREYREREVRTNTERI